MKKQYFIYSVITCMLVIFNVKAQNTPIDDFIKKSPYSSMKGVTHVSMSQQMLQSIFTPLNDVRVIGAGALPRSQSSAQASNSASATNETTDVKLSTTTAYQLQLSNLQNLNVPEAYSSMSVSGTNIFSNSFANFKKTLLSSKYEQIMEMNKENSIIFGYYLKKVNDKCNEIVVLRQQKDQFSAIYIKGDIEINQVDRYLSRIKSALDRMSINNIGIYQLNNQFANAMPSLDDLNFQDFNLKFDPDVSTFNFKMDEDFKLKMEESMKKAKEMMESGDIQRSINDSMEEAQRKLEE